jgi:hypothetical protein
MCTTEIVCARETAAGGGVLDYRGIVGFACSCGIPVRKLYMVMTTPEQFAYYTLGLHVLAQERTLCIMGCDSSCKLEPHLRRLFPEGSEEAYLWCNTQFCTGYMHGSTHIPSCVRNYHAAFAAGCGRLILEDMEHIFGDIKPPLKSLKYMSKGRFVEGLECVLELIAERKVRCWQGEAGG